MPGVNSSSSTAAMGARCVARRGDGHHPPSGPQIRPKRPVILNRGTVVSLVLFILGISTFLLASSSLWTAYAEEDGFDRERVLAGQDDHVEGVFLGRRQLWENRAALFTQRRTRKKLGVVVATTKKRISSTSSRTFTRTSSSRTATPTKTATKTSTKTATKTPTTSNSASRTATKTLTPSSTTAKPTSTNSKTATPTTTPTTTRTTTSKTPLTSTSTNSRTTEIAEACGWGYTVANLGIDRSCSNFYSWTADSYNQTAAGCAATCCSEGRKPPFAFNYHKTYKVCACGPNGLYATSCGHTVSDPGIDSYMVEPYKTPTQTTTSRTTSTSYTKTKIPFSTITKGPTPVNAPGPQDWVGAHNRRRTNATYGGPVPEVLWSNYLAKEAEDWLMYLVNTCQMRHPTYDGEPKDSSQNLFSTSQMAVPSADGVVYAWIDAEMPYYDFRACECNFNTNGGHICGHFVNAMWSTTEYIGCAVVKYSAAACAACNTDCTASLYQNGYIAACNYRTKGNCGDSCFNPGGICGNLPPDAITRTTKTKTTSTSSTSKTRLSSTSKTKYTTLTTLSSTTRAITTITEVPDGGSTNASTSQSYLAVAGSNTTVELALPATCAYQCFIYGFVGASNGAPLVSVFFAASNGSLARRQVASQPQEFARGSAGKIDFTFAVDNFEWALTQVCSSDAILAGKCKVVATVGDPAHWSAGTITLLASLQRLDSPAALSELRISQAISTGDSSLVTGNELRSAIASAASSQAVANNALITTIWSSPINLSASKIYWMLFDETIHFRILDTDNVFPVIMSSFDMGVGTDNVSVPLLVAGTALGGKGGRFAAAAENIIFDGTDTSVRLDKTDGLKMIKNVVSWLNGGVDPSPNKTFRITIAQFWKDECPWVYENQDGNTLKMVARLFPNATLTSPMNSCNGDKLAGCLANTDLLIISRYVDPAESGTWSDIYKAVVEWTARGKPVFYIHFYDNHNLLSKNLFNLFGIGILASNRVKKPRAWPGTMANTLANGNNHLTGITSLTQTLSGVTPLVAADLTNMIAGSQSLWTISTDASFMRKVGSGALAMHDFFNYLDSASISLFTMGGFKLFKLLALLGDKYRLAPGSDDGTPGFTYPINSRDFNGIASAVFADATVLFTRRKGVAQNDLGTLYCPESVLIAENCSTSGYEYRTYAKNLTLTSATVVEPIYPTMGARWTATGVFALPGQPVTVTLVQDENVEGRNIGLYIRFWYQSIETTRSFALDAAKNNTRYNRPQFARSPDLPLAPAGESVTFTSPYGGPIYLGFTGEGLEGGGKVTVTFDNIVRHPSVLDVSNATQIAAFASGFFTNPLPVVDLKAPGYEIHARRDKISGSLTGSMTIVTGATISYNSTAAGLAQLVSDYGATVGALFSLGGFRQPGSATAAAGFASEVRAVADFLKLTELYDDSINGVPNTDVHLHYDEVEISLGGKNPREFASNFRPTGWQESQGPGQFWATRALSLYWVSVNDTDVYDNYKYPSTTFEWGQSFGYYGMWHFHRRTRGINATLTMSSNDVVTQKMNWAIYTSDKRNQSITVANVTKRVAFDSGCRMVASSPYEPKPGELAYAAIWTSNDPGQGTDNSGRAMSERATTYWQMAIAASGITLADGVTVLKDGFQIFTLLNVLSRTLNYHYVQDTFVANRDRLGFGLFPPRNSMTGIKGFQNMPGNDFLLVGLSFLTKRDWMPFFRVRGIYYSTLANKQVESHILGGNVTGTISTDFAAFELEMAHYPTSAFEKVPIAPNAAWPRDSFNPGLCYANANGILYFATKTTTTTAKPTTTVKTA